MSYNSWKWKRKEKRPVNPIKAGWLIKAKLIPLRGAIDKLDSVFSRYKRLSALMGSGYIRCVTCGGFFSFRQIDCGHYVGRACMSLRYEDKNTGCQCHSCNRFSEGVKDQFAIYLQRMYGPSILEWLNAKKNELKFYSHAELEELIVIYKAKVKELEIKKLGRSGNK
jgi:hypothetical protein